MNWDDDNYTPTGVLEVPSQKCLDAIALLKPYIPVNCHQCGEIFIESEVEIEFLYAPEATRKQKGQGLKCSNGHQYFGGELAKEMHRKAFGKI